MVNFPYFLQDGTHIKCVRQDEELQVNSEEEE